MNHVDAPGVNNLQATLTFNRKTINQNNFSLSDKIRYRMINFRPDSIPDASYDLTVRASVPKGEAMTDTAARVYFSLISDTSSEGITLKDSYEISYYIDLPYINNWSVDPASRNDITLLYGDSIVDILSPTVIEFVTAYNVVYEGTTYKMNRYKFSYIVESDVDITFNAVRYDCQYFAIDLKNPEGDTVYFTQMGIGVFPFQVKEIAPEVVQEYYQAISAGNNDLKQYFGTVNQVDQNRIDSSNSSFSDFNNKVNDLGEAESELNTTIPEGAFDIPDIVTENLGVLDDYWSIFFGSDSDITPTGLNAFLRDTVVAVTVISMLSLVMFGIGGVISKIRGD